LTLFLKKINPGAIRGFVVFAGVFEGGSGKNAFSLWCFDGENVVECVVNVVR
jgi:hypothetical protein